LALDCQLQKEDVARGAVNPQPCHDPGVAGRDLVDRNVSGIPFGACLGKIGLGDIYGIALNLFRHRALVGTQDDDNDKCKQEYDANASQAPD
jgi:hypothetical protein